MARRIVGVVAGLALWMAVATLAGVMLRGTWPAYAKVADQMAFTLPMMIARLSIGALATLVAGALTTVLARRSALSAVATGLILLVLFVPEHIRLWTKFPVWYHLTFLLSLLPITYLGGKMAGRRHPVVGSRDEPRAGGVAFAGKAR